MKLSVPRPDNFRKKAITVDWGQWATPSLSPAEKAVYEALWAEEPVIARRTYFSKNQNFRHS